MSLPFERFARPVYRGHNPRWSFAPTSGDGASRYGARFNPVGVAALYTSVRPETAWLEAQQGFAFKAQPLTLCEYDVDCADVLDLTNPEIRSATDVHVSELACAWEELSTRGEEPPTWKLATRLMGLGCAGVIVPSFARRATSRDVNVVFWDWADSGPHRVRVVDEEGRLPRNDQSWR